MYSKILVAIEDPAADRQPYRQAVDLAAKTGGSLMLLHVLFPGEGNAPIPPGEELFFVPTLMPDDAALERYQQAWKDYTEENLRRLEVLGQVATEQGIQTEWSQNYGSPGKTICQVAHGWGASLIVVGRRQQSALSELFMGSVSNYVLHHAPCSVLVAKEPGELAATPHQPSTT
ncbi:MAG: universal stress protein [Oscillatoriales cyanobacterium]|nr:MAG: universal stress protein [Oscillatoriales cyanobacterium]